MVVKILSLFDGMACGMIAFKELGMPIERYVAYEIDKYAIKTATHNFPKIEEMGDVFAANFNEYRGFDWLIGGSPCTYWSIAQSKNRETQASGVGWELFCQYVRALNEAKPKYFLYENNKSMSNEIRNSISDTFGFEPIYINSAIVSAQSRQRLYWVGKRNGDGTYSKADILQPKDRGLVLSDVLENGQDLTSGEKAWAITTGVGRAYPQNTIERHQRNMVATPVRVGSLLRPNGKLSTSQGMRIYSVEGKSVTQSACGGGGAKAGLYAVPLEYNIRNDYVINVNENMISQKKVKSKFPAQGKEIIFPCALKASTLTARHAGNTKILFAKPTKNIYNVKNGMILINDKWYPTKLDDGYYGVRILTVKECARLQTIPEWYEFPVSKSQSYKMIGNGWTVEVIKHLITSAYSRPVVNQTKQLTFDDFAN